MTSCDVIALQSVYIDLNPKVANNIFCVFKPTVVPKSVPLEYEKRHLFSVILSIILTVAGAVILKI